MSKLMMLMLLGLIVTISTVSAGPGCSKAGASVTGTSIRCGGSGSAGRARVDSSVTGATIVTNKRRNTSQNMHERLVAAQMSLQANPLLYLNMGGEMLYVLRQRLKAQGIAVDKSIQVLDEVSASLLNPQIVSRLFQQSAPIDLTAIRANLEKAVLSSIMRLDETSMNKLFDLMIMMVKYQIQSATGPRELLLITLNHIDAMRDMPMNSSKHQSLILVHRMLLQLYGNLTYEEMWQARQACLIKLDNYNVRVSILLRLGLQREDGSFVPVKNVGYNERYEERREDLWNLRLLENSCQGCNVGSLKFVGDRVTPLGTNVYASFAGINDRIEKKCVNGKSANRRIRSSKDGADSRAELGMLAVQLGNNEDASCCQSPSSSQAQSRPFTLRLFSENSPEIIQTEEQDDNFARQDPDDNDNQQQQRRQTQQPAEEAEKPTSNNHYKAQLDNIYTDLIVDEEKDASVVRRMELLELMDQLE